MQLLLEHKAELETTDINGRTALFYAGGRNFPRITTMLIDAGIDTNHIDAHGKTALDYAIQNNKTDIINILKAGGGKPAAEVKEK